MSRFFFDYSDGRKTELSEQDFFAMIQNATGLDEFIARAILRDQTITHPSGAWRIDPRFREKNLWTKN